MTDSMENVLEEIQLYKNQLEQVNQLVLNDPNSDLLALQSDLIKIIELKQKIYLNTQQTETPLESNHFEEQTKEKDLDLEKNKIVNNLDLNLEIEKSYLDDLEQEDYNILIGDDCLAPIEFNNKIEYHEAQIVELDSLIQEDGDVNVLVKFWFPLNKKMKYCDDFYSKKCKVVDCNYSHGHKVQLSMLKDSMKKTKVVSNSSCLFKNENDFYWKKGLVLEVNGNFALINFNDNKFNINISNLVFYKEISEYNNLDVNFKSIDYNDSNDLIKKDSNEKKIDLNNFGEWERFTKGIGSKLMQKMGYVNGQGLGKNSEGIFFPIEIPVLPCNTSLDVCMNLKNKGLLWRSSEEFTFDKNKKLIKTLINEKIKLKKKAKKKNEKEANQDNFEFFDAVNETIKIKPKFSKDVNTFSNVNQIRKESKSSSKINVEIFKLEEETKKLLYEIHTLRKNISYFENKDLNKSIYYKQKLDEKIKLMNSNDLKMKVLKQVQKSRNYEDKRKCF